jgi:drug/metabolite transporter (DMT)-like permease
VSLAKVPVPLLSVIVAALLFGASTPFAKLLSGSIAPVMLAGLLYAGSGVGLAALRLARDRGWRDPGISGRGWAQLLVAIAFGGVAGPALLMLGLARTSAASASLLLNLESVLTALLAWLVFRESTDRRIVAGMLLIVAGGVALSWPSAAVPEGSLLGPAAIATACLCWAIDNNFTRAVSAADALFVAGSKGLAAGAVNVGLALVFGAAWPSMHAAAGAAAIGFVGYGVSLALYVVGLRGLGTARTAAYFSTAPFVGAVIAIVAFRESVQPLFWPAAALMAAGVYLHLSERHVHLHSHAAIRHAHLHVHDEHHRHEHDFAWDGREPHAHDHRHEALTHSHAHYPDIHHRHAHPTAPAGPAGHDA